MKYLACLVLFLSTLASAEKFKSPDLLIETKVDRQWAPTFISKIRKALKNYKLKDPLVYFTDKEIIFDKFAINKMFPAKSLDFINDVKKMSGVDIFNTNPEVRMDSFYYEVQGLNADLKTQKEQNSSLDAIAELTASEIQVNTNRLTISLKVPVGEEKLTPIEINIINPRISMSSEAILKLKSNLQVYNAKNEKEDIFKFKFINLELEQLARRLVEHNDSVQLSYDNIEIKASKIKFGNKVLEVDIDALNSYIADNQDAIKGFLLARLADHLPYKMGALVSQIEEKLLLKKDYWINSKALKIHLRADKFLNSDNRGNLGLSMPMNFCTHNNFNIYGNECLSKNENNFVVSRIDEKMHQSSVSEIQDMLDKNEADIVASISEDFFTKLLNSSHQAKLLDKFLEKSSLYLGPGKTKIRIEERGDKAKVYVDVIRLNTPFEQMFLTFSRVRFVLVAEVSIRIEKNDKNEDVLVIKAIGVDDSEKNLLYGRKDLGMESTIQYLGLFQGMVMDILRSKMKAVVGKDILTISLPEKLQNLGLDDVDFISDGKGRVNAILKLEKMKLNRNQ